MTYTRPTSRATIDITRPVTPTTNHLTSQRLPDPAGGRRGRTLLLRLANSSKCATASAPNSSSQSQRITRGMPKVRHNSASSHSYRLRISREKPNGNLDALSASSRTYLMPEREGVSTFKMYICSSSHGSSGRSGSMAARLLLGLLPLRHPHDNTYRRVSRVTEGQ